MFLQQVDLTSALRPTLQPDESLLFVQDNVGLYEGKYKIPDYQNGHVYLTSHRVCYVDNDEPRRRAVAINLKDVDRTDFYAGFLKSSAKITLIPVTSTRSPLSLRSESPRGAPVVPLNQENPQRVLTSSPTPKTSATWVCRICSFANPMPPNFDPASPRAVHLPPCKACGITPELIDLVKAALSANRQSARPPASSSSFNEERSRTTTNRNSKITCPRCTFDNDAALRECEVCGAPLIAVIDPRLDLAQSNARTPSPGPTLPSLSLNEDITSSVKFSFRAGGDKVFYERLKTALVQRKWLLQGAPPVPKPSESVNGSNSDGSSNSGRKLVGIAGLEMRGQAQRRNNEQIIGNAFEDLEALMTSAKEIIALAESFSVQAREDNGIIPEADSVISQSASALGLATTKDMLASDTLYISELSRNLAEFLLDDSKGILHKEGGIMSLVDVWAVFNRARNGVELVSPADFEKAAQMWEKLRLPIRLRRFRSGLLVVQGTDRTDERTISTILSWLRELHKELPTEDVGWDWQTYGRGVTIQEAATRFGWSMGVATEELEMAEERGVLCRDQGLDGVRFWENWLSQVPPETSSS